MTSRALPLSAFVQPDLPEPALLIGIAAIARLVYAEADLDPLRAELIARLTADPDDAGALLDASMLLQLTGQRAEALNYQAHALSVKRHYRRVHGRGDGLKVLALVTSGDLMANTPIDFLLEGSNVRLDYLFVDAATADLTHAPDHDVVFVAVGEADSHGPILKTIARLLDGWPRPVVNGATDRIARLSRDGASALLAGEPSLCAPVNVRVTREQLVRLALGELKVAALLDETEFPLIVRPVGLHAGGGLARLDAPADLAAYLGERPEALFYLAPYIDYASPDGLFRKQRIVFINGRAFPSHHAASSHWIVHYLSAGMAEDAGKRQEEADWMADFDSDFATRHAQAFAALCQRMGLGYFGIDSAETRDGRLLVFEVDVAMIVHALDPVEVFPYKKPAMERLFSAFVESLGAAASPPAAPRRIP